MKGKIGGGMQGKGLREEVVKGIDGLMGSRKRRFAS